jgi:hypothetical protein
VLEPCLCGVAEVERQILDDEEIFCRSPGMARKPVVLESHAGVGVPVVPWHVSRSTQTQRKLCVADALTKGPRTSVVRRPAAVVIVVAVMAPPTSTIVVVARTVEAVLVDTLGLSSGLNGVPHVMVGPEAAPDR